jgi:hypothetical protein
MLARTSPRSTARRSWLWVGLLGVGLLAGCSKKDFHWEDVPYCEVEPGHAAGHFVTSLRVLTKHGDGGGVSSLHGMRPLRDIEHRSEILVAVVACASDEMLPDFDLHAFLREFDSSTIPEVCPGQRTVVTPVEVEASPTDQPGFHGALPFPAVPDAELSCTAGTVALGRGVTPPS